MTRSAAFSLRVLDPDGSRRGVAQHRHFRPGAAVDWGGRFLEERCVGGFLIESRFVSFLRSRRFLCVSLDFLDEFILKTGCSLGSRGLQRLCR